MYIIYTIYIYVFPTRKPGGIVDRKGHDRGQKLRGYHNNIFALRQRFISRCSYLHTYSVPTVCSVLNIYYTKYLSP